MSDKNPFVTYDEAFQNEVSPLQPLTAVPNMTEKDIAKRKNASGDFPVHVTLPKNLFVPEQAQSVDIHKTMAVAAGAPTTIQEIFKFICPENKLVWFQQYAIFSNAADLTKVQFIPRVNGTRIFPYQGDPMTFNINSGLGADLSNQNMIDGQLYLKPGDVLTWTVINTGAAINVGVRHRGYADTGTIRRSGRFGG